MICTEPTEILLVADQAEFDRLRVDPAVHVLVKYTTCPPAATTKDPRTSAGGPSF